MDAARYQRLDVSSWPLIDFEQQGSNGAQWLENPVDGVRWLHKDTIIPSTGLEQGEDWAEVLSSAVAEMIGVPCAATLLCSRAGRRGSLSRDIRPPWAALWGGGVALELCPDAVRYQPHREGRAGIHPARPGIKRPGHNLANIKRALAGAVAPPGFAGPAELDAFDVFAGYLVFDALVANRDRHEENWAVLVPLYEGSPTSLAPSYDHAGSLGPPR